MPDEEKEKIGPKPVAGKPVGNNQHHANVSKTIHVQHQSLQPPQHHHQQQHHTQTQQQHAMPPQPPVMIMQMRPPPIMRTFSTVI